jgi:hypothetical protein
VDFADAARRGVDDERGGRDDERRVVGERATSGGEQDACDDE